MRGSCWPRGRGRQAVARLGLLDPNRCLQLGVWASPASVCGGLSFCPRSAAWEAGPEPLPHRVGAGVMLGGVFVSISDSLHGFEAVVGLDLRGGCRVLWFKSEEGLPVKIDAPF